MDGLGIAYPIPSTWTSLRFAAGRPANLFERVEVVEWLGSGVGAVPIELLLSRTEFLRSILGTSAGCEPSSVVADERRVTEFAGDLFHRDLRFKEEAAQRSAGRPWSVYRVIPSQRTSKSTASVTSAN